MKKDLVALALAGAVLSSSIAVAVTRGSAREVALDQKVDPSVLALYHYTDQGTRLVPTAWLAALKTVDGSQPFMSRANTEAYGFITADGPRSPLNPLGWPIGWTVTDPKTNNGVSTAGITCAACHTGQLEYHGRKIRIEGGAAMIDLPAFEQAVLLAFGAVAKDPARKTKFIKDAIAAGYPADRMQSDFDRFVAGSAQMLEGKAALTEIMPGPGRVDAVQGIADALLRADINQPSNRRKYNAPVNYPYLWDIWRLSWLQYNGFMPWPHAVSRNIGEVLGTSGRTRFLNPKGALNPEPERWRTSIQIGNLQKMEGTLETMTSPAWPNQILGPINAAKMARGRQLFTTNCAGCHGIKELPSGAWDVAVVELQHVGTDPNQAVNWAGRVYDGSKLGLGPAVRAPAAATIINAVRNQYYADTNTPSAQREGDVTFGSACGYKARPLIGVWSTPPFLHNGSVRTVYDLLSETRAATFGVGTRVFDPVRLGYVDDKRSTAFRFDATVDGNSNAGHWWTDDASRPGRIGRKLTEAEKMAIIEFLKGATYANYPRLKAAKEQPVPCADKPDWAVALAK